MASYCCTKRSLAMLYGLNSMSFSPRVLITIVVYNSSILRNGIYTAQLSPKDPFLSTLSFDFSTSIVQTPFSITPSSSNLIHHTSRCSLQNMPEQSDHSGNPGSTEPNTLVKAQPKRITLPNPKVSRSIEEAIVSTLQ